MPMPKISNGQLTLVFVILKNKEAYSEPCQTSKMKLFVKIVDVRWLFAKSAKNSILDV